MNPFFSILIPAYNQVGKMDRCFASLEAQKFADYEVIFTNDGSTDDTYAMLEKFCAPDSRRKLTNHEKNSSLLAARYTGMSLAKGRYILFLDSDDWLSDDALALLHEALSAQPDVDFLRFGYVLEPEGKTVEPYETDDYKKSLIECEFPPAIWKNCYRRDMIERVLERTEPFYCNMGEDVFFASVFSDCFQKTATLCKYIYHYDCGTGMSSSQAAVSSGKMQRDLQSVLASRDNLIRYYEKYAPQDLIAVKKRTVDMVCFVLFQGVFGAKDWNMLPDMIKVLATPNSQAYFDFCCDELIPLRMRSAAGQLDKMTLWGEYLKRRVKLYETEAKS